MKEGDTLELPTMYVEAYTDEDTARKNIEFYRIDGWPEEKLRRHVDAGAAAERVLHERKFGRSVAAG